ncbi:uncharacterized protein M437DRAFT_85816 [Aureobasidium melanogenum CBS 110374]|uniref:RNI-like protein n=1 Tax=Aureobasidium melanogenum (strain CBS 110374) TaxID=1043003 RepID=A0A074VKV4_AURM1|nr:uncharacterized protein M437DRAFT_85816 [Aureobasidium melanogenum CBS 110374]KEQ61365.1 hypothetical protein M437DRAFT_85816 [Aureobasidium melanogenum CBS 110374]
MPKLNYLELNNPVKQPKFFQSIRIQNNFPFQNLTEFELNATSAVISAAARVLPNVVKLGLCLQDGNGSCFKDLSDMPRLCKLKILGTRETTFARHELLALRALNRLEKLTIKTSEGNGLHDMLALQFTNSDFDAMVSGMPELRKLEFEVIWENRSVSILSSLSEHCPKLEELDLDGSYDLQALNDTSTVMFPNLKSLRIDDCVVHYIPVRLTPLQLGRLIDNHAPILEDLAFMVDFDDNPVLLAWHDIRG